MLKIENRGCHGNGSVKIEKKCMHFCSSLDRSKKWANFQENRFFLFPADCVLLLKFGLKFRGKKSQELYREMKALSFKLSFRPFTWPYVFPMLRCIVHRKKCV